MTYDKGDGVRLTATFQNISGTLADPTTITLQVALPDGTTIIKTYAAGQVTKGSTGYYYYDILLSQVGTWAYHWEGAGAVEAASEYTLTVEPTQF